MELTQKEKSLLKDMKDQEQLCVEKYTKYASDACDGQLKNLFTQIGKIEQGHYNTLTQIENGTVPQPSGGESLPSTGKSSCDETAKNADKYLCSDALATEKHASSLYDTCIFEFADVQLRNTLNHIQKEEQEHGEKIYAYMSQNGMYS